MEDRFKFRVWQTDPINKMKYESGLVICKNQLLEEECKIMQCTGLKDKNGKLIYEKDIVKIDDDIFETYDEFRNQNAMITYREEQAKWFIEYPPKDNSFENVRELVENFYHFLKSHNTLEYIEIIGNIHENPELLG